MSAGGEDFSGILRMPGFPSNLIKSRRDTQGFLLSDPDLYLTSLQSEIPNAEIAEALREAIQCFRSELFLACAVMLGKASEGVWIELGKALIRALPKTEQPARAKLLTDLDNSIRPSFAMKLQDILKFYETSQAHLGHIGRITGVSLDQFRLAFQWSDMLRDSRNVVHYGSQPNIPNNYTNVATLLLAGSTHLRNLLAVHSAAISNQAT